MRNRLLLTITALLLITLTGCSALQSTASLSQAQASGESSTRFISTESQSASLQAAVSVAEALSENSQVHEDPEDYLWDITAEIPIQLNGDSIQVDADGVEVDGDQLTITSAGTYRLSGSLVDGQIIVDTDDKEIVRLILDGVDISSSTSAPLYIRNAEEILIFLADGSDNLLSDAGEYLLADPQTDEPNAAIFSAADLTIAGEGALSVYANYNDGIASKDGLLIASGKISLQAVDDGMRGKDYLVIKGGSITVNAQGDGLKSDNTADASCGYISIEAGEINISAGGDAIEAESDVLIAGGSLNLISGDGSQARLDQDTSAKGIKASVSITIAGGTFTINSADDALNSNGSIEINGGSFLISSGDDGMHADKSLTINGGDIRVNKSYEGLESAVITINSGDIYMTSSDDGINVAGGVDSSGMNPGMGGRMAQGGRGQDLFSASGNYYLYINGGVIVLDAGGDGLDVNGAAEMTGGVVLLNGPIENMNGALDYYTTFNISDGTLLAVGSAGMAQAPSESSSQYSLLVNLSSAQRAGTLVHIHTSTGQEVLTFSPSKSYQSIVFSSPDLEKGTTYEIFLGGSSSGSVVDGLYQGGSYSGGTQLSSLTISSTVTYLGSSGGFGGGRMPGGGRP